MAVVIRLQGLRITAGSEDIRKFFTGLKIPDGGVHIIGGEKEEAFIIFASDEDARRAMTRSGGCIKGIPVTLLLSSKTEMQTILERSTQKAELDLKMRFEENARYGRRSVDPEVGRRAGHSPPRQHQRPANTEDFLHGSVRRMPEMGRRFGGRSGHTPPPQHQRAANTDDSYLFLRGMPFSVTEMEIRDFFGGLCVDRIFFLQHVNGKNNGKAYVKFASSEDAKEGLKRDKNYIGSRYVEVFKGMEDDVRRAVGDVSMAVNMNNNSGRERSPLRSQRNPPHQERERSPIRNQRSPQHHARSLSPFAQRSAAPSNDEFCVLLENLPYTVDKEDIKKLFRNAKLEDDQILHLTGRDGRRTRSTFVLFQSMRDYFEALAHEKREFHNRCIFTRPISREKMITLLESQSMGDRPPGFSEGFQDRHPSDSSDSFDSEKTCLFVQNLPFDVRKVEIVDFFMKFNITENKVVVLRDHDGGGVGKALIRFQSEAEARNACSLNGRRFLGSVVVLKCITYAEMEQLAAESPAGQEPFAEELQQREEQCSGRSSEASYHTGYNDYPDCGTPRDGNMQRTNVRGGGGNSEPCDGGSFAPQDRGNGFRGAGGRSGQHFDRPICVQLVNLPFQIKSEEIYDFCYGYRIIPGSVSIQYDQRGKPQGTATALFESRQEALTAIEELSGRPIGPRKIQLLLA